MRLANWMVCVCLFPLVESEDVKKLASTLNALANEKVKAQKALAVGVILTIL